MITLGLATLSQDDDQKACGEIPNPEYIKNTGSNATIDAKDSVIHFHFVRARVMGMPN